MNTDHRFVDVRNAIHQRFDPFGHFKGRRVSHGVGNIHGRRARVDYRLDNFAQEIDLSTARVFGRKLDIRAITSGAFDAFNGATDNFLLRHAQFEFTVNRASRQKDVNSGIFRFLQGFPGAINVFIDATRKSANRGAAHDFRDFANRVEIPGRRDRKPCFDHVDAELDESLSDLYLFVQIHACAGRLLSVAQRRVKNNYLTSVLIRYIILRRHYHTSLFLGRPRRPFYFNSALGAKKRLPTRPRPKLLTLGCPLTAVPWTASKVEPNSRTKCKIEKASHNQIKIFSIEFQNSVVATFHDDGLDYPFSY